ncbi:MAG: hypothetical protein D6732_16075 [Methanobacteriota archaeon]|nr:MAG: hypothetical protein D6732_16075 [Euryarchaeota archaeon]
MHKFDEAKRLIRNSNAITVLTGAGISAESGIPTFRGKNGFWVSGSKNYTPQDFARFSYFRSHPIEVLKWYRERQIQISHAQPNQAHYALAELERQMSENKKSFLIITQNIDNLHRKAGSKKIAEIHGNIFEFRCSSTYSSDKHHLRIFNLDLSTVENVETLRCEKCNAFLRPNVLWFDETYDPRFFDIELAETHFQKTDLLIVVGTTLQTTFPYLLVESAIGRNLPIIEINPEPVMGKLPVFSFADSAATVLPKLI